MKHLEKQLIIPIILVLISASAFSQDTVFFKNQGVTVVKVIEVNKDHIKYMYPSDSLHFVYDMDKSKLVYIKYRNGLVDSIKPAPAVVQMTNYSENDIQIDDKKLMYKGKRLNGRRLKFLIANCPDGEAKLMMLEDYRQMKAYQRRQSIYTPIGAGIGGALIPASIVYVFLNNDESYDTEQRLQTIGLGIIAGAFVTISSAVISSISRAKRYHKREQIALLYNDIH